MVTMNGGGPKDSMVIVTEIAMLCKDGPPAPKSRENLKRLKCQTTGEKEEEVDDRVDLSQYADIQRIIREWSIRSSSSSENGKVGNCSIQVLVGSKKSNKTQKKREFQQLTEALKESTSISKLKIPRIFTAGNTFKREALDNMTHIFFEKTLDECRRRAAAAKPVQTSMYSEFTKSLDSEYTHYKYTLLTKLVVTVILGDRETDGEFHDKELVTDLCHDSMIDTLDDFISQHLGVHALHQCVRKMPKFAPLQWLDTRELLDFSHSLDPYTEHGMPVFDAKGRTINVVMLTELHNILNVHLLVLIDKVWTKNRTNGGKDTDWLPLVETCLNFGIMLQNFLTTISDQDDYGLMRKCIWLIVAALGRNGLVEKCTAYQYMKMPRPELNHALRNISTLCLRQPSSRVHVFRFTEWYLTGHCPVGWIFLNDYVSSRIPFPRIALLWEGIECKYTSGSGGGGQISGCHGGAKTEASQNLLNALEVFIQVEKRKMEVAPHGLDPNRKCTEMLELSHWLNKLMVTGKAYAADACYLTWHYFDHLRFSVAIDQLDKAIHRQYSKREVIYYLTARFCLNILHEEMRKQKYNIWDKSSVPFQTFSSLFRRLFLPNCKDSDYVFRNNETAFDRVAAKIVETMRMLLKSDNKKALPPTTPQPVAGSDLHSEDLLLFTNETTQTYVRLEQQVTASLNDTILSSTNQKQVDNFISRVLEALVATTLEKRVTCIDWLFMGRCLPLYILDLYKLLAKNNLLGYPSVFAYSTKTFIDKFLHEKITTDGKTIDEFLNNLLKDAVTTPRCAVEENPLVKSAERYFRMHEEQLIQSLVAPVVDRSRSSRHTPRKK